MATSAARELLRTASVAPMKPKPLARYLYAHVPSLASLRFLAKDLLATRFMKSEFRGLTRFQFRNPLIVDVGANRGQSIAAFKALAPQSLVVAFEPDPDSGGRIACRYRNDPTVAIHRCALSDQSSTITLFSPYYGRWNCDGMAALDRSTAIEWLRDPGRMYRFDESKLTVREHEVPCRTLDTFQLEPSLIKIHAQGAELLILQGARETLVRRRPALMCAFPTAQVTTFLASFRYYPYIYERTGFKPGIAGQSTTFTWFLMDEHVRFVFGSARQRIRGSRAPRTAGQFRFHAE